MTFSPPGYCPNCGDFVEEGAEACECCGSCKKTGWNEDSTYDGLDLPETEEEREGSRREKRIDGKLVVVVLLVLLLAWVFVFR